MIFENATLYVVGTPIGNLSDISPRAAETLKECDFIAAEDTRVTLKLLNSLNIKKELVSYHKNNELERGVYIIERLLAGEKCALVTDAGMPAISDPGAALVRLCAENGIKAVSVPGPSAAITALAISGMDSSRFCFEGFLTGNKPKRRAHLEDIKDEKRTMIFYEAPHKLEKTLRDLYETLGSRQIAVIKELTKIHENVDRTTFADAIEKYGGQKLKGEFVIIIESKKQDKKETDENNDITAAVFRAEEYVKEGYKPSEAAKLAAKETGFAKSEVYKGLV